MTRFEARPRASARSWPVSVILWVVAHSIMSAFQFWRGAPIDGAIFAVIASGLVVERVARLRRADSPAVEESSSSRSGAPRFAIIVAVALTAALAIIALPRTGAVSITLIVALGLGAVALVWHRPPLAHDSAPPSRRRSRIAWGSLGIALCLWEALAYILSVAVPRGWKGFPTLSLLLEPAVEFDPSRALLTVAWLAAGVWLIVSTATRRAAPRVSAPS